MSVYNYIHLNCALFGFCYEKPDIFTMFWKDCKNFYLIIRDAHLIRNLYWSCNAARLFCNYMVFLCGNIYM